MPRPLLVAGYLSNRKFKAFDEVSEVEEEG